MSTYMTWVTSGGKRGRCDARCHNAKGKKCLCACGGAMHGKAKTMTPEQWFKYQDEEAFGLFEKLTADMDAQKIKKFNFTPTQKHFPI